MIDNQLEEERNREVAKARSMPPALQVRLPMLQGKLTVILDYRPPLTAADWDKMVEALGALRDVLAVELPEGTE